MKSERRIKTSGQLWKLYASLIGILITGCTMLYGVSKVSEGRETSIALILSAIAAEIAIGLFACMFIRCPDCGLKWVWYAVSQKEMNQWVSWLVSFERCPGCEHD